MHLNLGIRWKANNGGRSGRQDWSMCLQKGLKQLLCRYSPYLFLIEDRRGKEDSGGRARLKTFVPGGNNDDCRIG